MRNIISMLLGGIIALIVLYCIKTFRPKPITEEDQTENWKSVIIPDGNNRDWGYIITYKLPYPENENTKYKWE